MAAPAPDLAGIREGLSEIVEPLKAQLVQIDHAIEQQAAALTELRATRSAITKTIAMLDPSSVAKSTKRRVSPENNVSKEFVEELHTVLVDNAEQVNGNGGFTAKSIWRNFSPGGRSPSTIANALRVLHDQGLIRLDHRGRGGANYWKLVS